MEILIRFVIITLMIYLLYKGFRYLTDPKRKIRAAHGQGRYYFYDDVKSVHKNFFITYKGLLFEGEKYLSTDDEHFRVASIFVWVKDEAALTKFKQEDFHFLQSKILTHYPHATVNWKNPIEQLMKK